MNTLSYTHPHLKYDLADFTWMALSRMLYVGKTEMAFATSLSNNRVATDCQKDAGLTLLDATYNVSHHDIRTWCFQPG